MQYNGRGFPELRMQVMRLAGRETRRARTVQGNIPTLSISGRFIGGESVEMLAEDYELPAAVIEEAIRYELFRKGRSNA